MTKCNGITKLGKRCRANATNNGYCQWHADNKDPELPECIVCYEPFSDGETALPCGHWVHRICVQKSADAMQEIRAEEGYPPITECLCPICKRSVEGLEPKEAPPVPPLDYIVDVVLSTSEIHAAYDCWEHSARLAPLSWYIWIALSEKYPHIDNDSLITASNVFESMIYAGMIDPRPPQPDTRFARILNQAWRT